MRTKTVLATLLLTTLGLPLAATAEDFTNWSLTLTNSDGTPAGSGTFRADADIQYRTPALDIDITVNGVEYDFTFKPGDPRALQFNNYFGSLGEFALSSNEDGVKVPCIGFNQVEFMRWDYFLCHVLDGAFKGAQLFSTHGSFSVKPAADTTPPVVSNVIASDVEFPADVTVTATATNAQSNIKSAEYSRDGNPWVAMSAADGAFDWLSEDLTATLSGLFVKTYEVCVRASDVEENISDGTACDTFDVTPAQLSIAFAGQELDLDGAPTQLKAEVTGPCSSGAEVEFFADVGSGYASVGTADTDTSGVATVNAVLPVGVHDIKVKVDDQDMGGDSAPECKGDTDIGITVVADPKASSTGGGWYKVDATPPRVNFGYTAQRKYNKKLDEYSTSGNLLWMHQDSYRLKGAIDSGGMLPDEMCDPEFAACAAFAGEGTLYEHNPDYDPAYPPTDYRGVEWINPSPNTPFVIFVNDGGTSRECVGKKKCKVVEKPDQFGIQIDLESVPAESDPVYLNGGNLVVR